ncbi:MAG TPA: hypothetical protein PKK43_10345 [Spirochaetota bacterium]|nr:hypothetical protein [Spirochaetota bacterium]
MKPILPLCLITLLFAGCATFQDPVDEAYLTEMTQEEKAALNKIAGDIIAKKAEKDAAEAQVSISDQSIEVSKSQLSVIDAQRDLAVRKEKFYQLSKDSAKQSAEMGNIKSSDTQKVQENAHLDYCKAKRDVDQCTFKVKEAELGVLVAQMDLEKARIARKFQEKRKKEDDSTDLIEVKKYDDYYKKQKDDLISAQNDLKKANDSLLLADDKLKKTGYGK